MMYGHEKSRSAIVAGKPTNKAERSAAELVERRAETKGNAGQQRTCRAQYRISVSKMLARIRQHIFAVDTQGGNRMRESCTYGSVRGALSNERPYRDRREFITLLGGAAAVSWPARPRGEQRSKRLIGNLGAASPASSTSQYQAWVGGLRELGYVEGQDYEIVAKWAFGVMDRLPALAEELIQLKPDVIVAAPTPAVAALHTKTASIPIVSFMLADEVRLGLVASSARPGGNVTGLSMRLDGMVGKQIELATELIPTAKITGVLLNPTSADTANQLAQAKAACATLKLPPVFVEARSPSDISSAFQQF